MAWLGVVASTSAFSCSSADLERDQGSAVFPASDPPPPPVEGPPQATALGSSPISADATSLLPAVSLEEFGQVVSTAMGHYRLSYRSNVQPIPMNEIFGLEVWVTDADGNTLTDQDVNLRIDADMPAHRHGMNTRPEVVFQEDGTFLVDGMLFHMPGAWEIYFDLERSGRVERGVVGVDL